MLILKPDTKKCMSELLLHETFDSFLFIEGDITTFNQFHIDGFLKKKFFSDEEIEERSGIDYSYWKDIREFCFSIIKGKHTPLDFKFIFSLPAADMEGFLIRVGLNLTTADVKGLYLNFRYNGESLSCITGTSFHTFVPDKSLEQAWDKEVLQIFEQLGIPYSLPE